MDAGVILLQITGYGLQIIVVVAPLPGWLFTYLTVKQASHNPLHQKRTLQFLACQLRFPLKNIPNSDVKKLKEGRKKATRNMVWETGKSIRRFSEQ